MAEVLAVAGVVANIVQLVDFGSKVLRRLNDFHSKLGEIPRTLRCVKDELPILLDTLEQTKKAVEEGSIRDQTKHALLPIINSCREQVGLLDEIVGKMLPQESDSWRKRTTKAFSSLRQDTKVAEIRDALSSHIQKLTYYHAAASSTIACEKPEVSSPQPTPSSTVPFRRDKDFVYREIISQIDDKCSQPAARVALVGLGGVGKSQLAIEYSYRVQEKSPATWVFWVHAGSVSRFHEGYRKIAERARITGWDNPNVDIMRLVYNWLSDEANGTWLMIADNADDVNILLHSVDENSAGDNNSTTPGQSMGALFEFLPQSSNGCILVTSRNRDAAFQITGDTKDIISVGSMNEDLSVALLHKKLQDNFNEDDAKKLSHALDYMPLAITQAAAFISQRTPHITLSKYLQDLQKGSTDMAKLLNKHVSDSRRDGKASNSIIATWQISFENIRKHRPSAAQLLSLMCLFDRQGIPKSLLDGYYQDEDENNDFDEDIYTLHNYSLIGTNLDGSEYEMHRLVQFSTRTWVELTNNLEKLKEKFIAVMKNEFPLGKYENWTICHKLFPHAQKTLEYRPKNPNYLEQWAYILFKTAWYAKDQGHYGMAEFMYRQALYGYKAVLGDTHPDTLITMANLASTYWNQGRWKDAEDLQVQVLKTRKEVLGDTHPNILSSMANLASIYSKQGRWKDAEDLEVQVLKTRKEVLGDTHPHTLSSMANLASTYRMQGRWKDAEDLEVQVLKTRKEVLGDTHPDTLSSIANLASTYSKQGRWKDAEDLQIQVLKTRKEVLGNTHPDTLSSMANLACTYWNQGRWKDAEDLEIQVLKTRKEVLGDTHPNTLITMANLACTYWNQGRWKDAEDLQVQVLKTSKEVLGDTHPDIITRMANLAITYKSQGRDRDALELLRECVQLQTRILGPKHPSTINCSTILTNWETEELQIGALEVKDEICGERVCKYSDQIQ